MSTYRLRYMYVQRRECVHVHGMLCAYMHYCRHSVDINICNERRNIVLQLISGHV